MASATVPVDLLNPGQVFACLGIMEAAEILCVSQSRVSDLIRGKWEKFSLEMLITLATRAGMHVTLKTAA